MSKKITVRILTEGSQKTGMGHVMRCLSLCQAFTSKGIHPTFIVNGDMKIDSLMSGQEYEIFDWSANNADLRQLLRDTDVVIIDSYEADLDTYRTASELVEVPVFIDDYKRYDYPRGLIINMALNADHLNYPKKDGIRYLLGNQYILLRKEFWDVSDRDERDQVENFILIFGGADHGGMMSKTLELLKCCWPDSEKNIIVGPAFNDVECLKIAADKKTRLYFAPPASFVKEIMANCDIAISAAGQTLYELARIGVPTIAVTVADNQKNNIEAWLETGCILHAGCSKDPKIMEKIEKNLQCLKSLQERHRLSKGAKILVDGLGAIRVVEEIFNTLNPTVRNTNKIMHNRNYT